MGRMIAKRQRRTTFAELVELRARHSGFSAEAQRTAVATAMSAFDRGASWHEALCRAGLDWAGVALKRRAPPSARLH